MSKEHTMTEKLKPCPFCGGEAKAITPTSGSAPYVLCVRCHAGGPVSSSSTMPEAITAWNTRPVEPCSECDAVSAAIGGCEFLDPPDGGDVPLSEQVRRMREALTAAASRIEELERAVSKAARMLANPDQHELTRLVDARDLLLAALPDKG